MIERIFYHYTEWEDYQAGMYDEVKEGRENRVKSAAELLGGGDLITLCYMRAVVLKQPKAAAQNLSNLGMNRRAWIGQSACNLYAGCKEDETREAWGLLSTEQRRIANDLAEFVISEWEKNCYEEIMSLLVLVKIALLCFIW